MENLKKKVLGASIGNCVHVAGVYHFLQLAEKEGYNCIFILVSVFFKFIFKVIIIKMVKWN